MLEASPPLVETMRIAAIVPYPSAGVVLEVAAGTTMPFIFIAIETSEHNPETEAGSIENSGQNSLCFIRHDIVPFENF